MKRLMKSESGVALVFTLMVLVVLSVLGATIGTVAMANVNLTENERDYQAAYYIAEAGMNEAYLDIEEIVKETYKMSNTKDVFLNGLSQVVMNQVNGKEFNQFDKNMGVQPVSEIAIHVEREDSNVTFKLVSIGRIADKERKVSRDVNVNWIPKDSQPSIPSLPEGISVVVRNKIDLEGSGSIHGDVYLEDSGSNLITITGEGNNRIKGTLYVNEGNTQDIIKAEDYINRPEIKQGKIDFNWDLLNLYMGSVNYPKSLPSPGDVDFITNNNQRLTIIKNKQLELPNDGRFNEYTLEMEQDLYLSSIKTNWHKTLWIDTKGEERNLVIDTLNNNGGHIEVVGGGKLNLYITNTYTSNGGKINQLGNRNQVTLYYFGLNNYSYSNSNVNHNLFIKQAGLTIGGGGDVSGVIISGGNKVDIGNGAVAKDLLLIAPFGDVKISGDGYSGGIVAKKLIVSGGSIVNYKHLDTTDLPFKFDGNDSDKGDSIIDLIQSSITKEN